MVKVIQEGVCDFMVELLTGNEPNNDKLRFLEDEGNWQMIVNDFKAERETTDLSKWMYNGGNTPDRPGDIGYTLGYLISKSYYQNHPDKKAAVYNLLNTGNFYEIYE